MSSSEVTDDDIEALRAQAHATGNYDLAAIAVQALDGDSKLVQMTQEEARSQCVATIMRLRSAESET